MAATAREWVAAVDFGATSVRVCRIGLGDGAPDIEVVHRRSHQATHDGDGTLRWDWPRLVEAMEVGLGAALDRGPLASIGIDTWGVDYGLLDQTGALVEPPISYRDGRTAGYRTVVERLGAEALWRRTGLQLQPFNTIFQLAAHDPRTLGRARRLLLLPELLVHHLTGAVTGEATSAGTTGLVDLDTGDWAVDLVEAVGVDPSLLPPITRPGARVGTWRGVPVHLVGGHDTASAVAGMGPVRAGTAFVSAGTWFLVGAERDRPDRTAAARAANFTNEVAVGGGFRVLRNLAGGWLVERCRAQWDGAPVAELLAAAGREPPGPTVDVADPRFLDPVDMVAEITAAAGLVGDAAPGAVMRVIIESMAAGIATTVDHFTDVDEIAIFGGAANWELLRERVAARARCRVRQGSTEATAVGNALVQGVAIGCYPDLGAARQSLAGVGS